MLAYGRMNKSLGGQIVEAPSRLSGEAGKIGRPDDEVPRAPQDNGCNLARACLKCTFTETCQKCTRKTAECAGCSVYLSCPLMQPARKPGRKR